MKRSLWFLLRLEVPLNFRLHGTLACPGWERDGIVTILKEVVVGVSQF